MSEMNIVAGRNAGVVMVAIIGQVLLAGCSPNSLSGSGPNLAFGSPSGISARRDLVASVTPSLSGYRIQVLDRKRGTLVWEGAGNTVDTNPILTADGSIVFFERTDKWSKRIWAAPISGSEESYPLSDEQDTILDVSPSGKWLIVSRFHPSTGNAGTCDIGLISSATGSAMFERYGAGASFLSDDEVLCCLENGNGIVRKRIGKASKLVVSKGVFPVLSLNKKQLLCVEDPFATLSKREWLLYSIEGECLGCLGSAYSPTFSSTGDEVLYIPKELNGELWMWHIATNTKRRVGNVGYVSQMRSSPFGVLFLVDQGTNMMATGTVDETTWTPRIIPFSKAKPPITTEPRK